MSDSTVVDTAPDTRVLVNAHLSERVLRVLTELAKKRGVTANTVVEQAILNERFFNDALGEGAEVLLQKPDRSIVRVDLPK